MTQQEKIMKIMEREPKRWFLAKDFMQPHLGELFVGYEASARLSELTSKGMVDTKRIGRFRAVKYRSEPKEIEPKYKAPFMEGIDESLEKLTIRPKPDNQPKAISWLND